MNLVEEFLENKVHLTEMAKVGHFGDYIIEMFSNEGPIPHFHFVNVHNKQVKGCIYLTKNKYFMHGCYTATLNSKERKLLVEFLNQKANGISKYKDLCIKWNWTNSDYQFEAKEIPNYLEIEK